ncbi:MAG TPA: hypothetical protein VIV59_04310 [Anaeromyxobacteraceae bacterium]
MEIRSRCGGSALHDCASSRTSRGWPWTSCRWRSARRRPSPRSWSPSCTTPPRGRCRAADWHEARARLRYLLALLAKDLAQHAHRVPGAVEASEDVAAILALVERNLRGA